MSKLGLALSFIIVILAIGDCRAESYYKYRPLGSFDLTDPSFLNLGYFTPENRGANNRSLIITCFSGSPFKKDAIYLVDDIGNKLDSFSTIKPELVTTQLVWPNEATAVPYDIFNMGAIGLGNGFLVPGKSTGSVSVIPANTSTPHSISTPKKNWFYHVAKWWDMNGDGVQDCVSARAYVPTFGSTQGQLVWFTNPSENVFSEPWEENVLASGPDIMIELVWLDGDASENQPQIVAAEFFSQKLTLWWTENNALWSEGNIQSRVIDAELGAPFDVQFIDLNNDGKRDLLVTNHQGSANQSAVFAYTVPENWQTDPWPRYVLATNITTLVPGPNQASPGRGWAFHPNTNQTDSKPYISVAGDGAEVAFMLYPDSEDPNNWSYTREDIIFTGCTVGQITIGDVDGDSWVEFFVPAYENGIVYGYTYSPAK